MNHFTALLFAVVIAITSGVSHNADARAPLLVIKQQESSISFVANVNNAPTEGKFTSFNGTIHFSPDDLEESEAHIQIDLSSVEAEYEEVVRNLLKEPWFHTDEYETAEFHATRFKHIEGKSYKAYGKLSLKGVDRDVTLPFTLLRYDENGAAIKGTTTLERTDFNVGSGEWEATDTVKDDVMVKIYLETKFGNMVHKETDSPAVNTTEESE
jgi:polyisoprenoid-binding protein YceI